jgi:hypothetical protein
MVDTAWTIAKCLAGRLVQLYLGRTLVVAKLGDGEILKYEIFLP